MSFSYKGFHKFEHPPSCAAKVRNVSSVGTQTGAVPHCAKQNSPKGGDDTLEPFNKRPHVVTNFQKRNELFGMQGEIQAIGKLLGCAAQVT